jgi:hypothetical protein
MGWLMTGIIVFACIGDVLITRHYDKSMKYYSYEMQRINQAITNALDEIVNKAKAALEANKNKE